MRLEQTHAIYSQNTNLIDILKTNCAFRWIFRLTLVCYADNTSFASDLYQQNHDCGLDEPRLMLWDESTAIYIYTTGL